MKFREVEQKLSEKGYYTFNMAGIYNDEYEVYDREGSVVKSHLNVNGLVELLNIL